MMRFFPRLLVLLSFVLLVLSTGCGPTYPDCEGDDHCGSHDQVCVNKKCVECRDDTQCAAMGPCSVCGVGGSCVTQTGCCTSDLDCPGGKCWPGEGAAGMCGGMCKGTEGCPDGQICSGGSCIPDKSCSAQADCGPGEKCEGGQCVSADCEVQTIHFDFNETAIRLDMEAILAANAQCMMDRGIAYRVEGHCDDRGSDEYNLALGQRRAGSVARQYTQRGVAKGRVSTISYGEERPECVGGGETCWSQNRRVVTTAQ